ncbi:Tripartite tricarboxylate transporter family receptor [compost metagenome]|uniref:Tripartite tricarboxylate transporter family receptor n=1 Tax=Achromobacter agilis TaxID=1353888 RepID=A0A446CIS2_9BURK|nr:tripartite tricarboxylate transporter substrate binding protein [Achromobacter agilis]SSW67769.1 hypothetical protein AGI3411_03252 [Achromobacter agilis]
MRPFRLSALAISALSAVSVLSAAHAADYPARSMELVVAYQPGGGSDNTARAIAEAVRPPMMAQPTVVINKPGASGSIGWAYVANAQPDGYKLVLMTPEMLVVPLMGIGKTTVGDFQPVARFTDDPSSVTVSADAPWKTVEEFLDDARKHPERIAVSNAGIGTVPHMAAAALGEQAGVKFVHVPYQGSAPAIMGLLAGDVQATTVAYAELQQHVETGKLRTLAVMAPKRLDNLPGVPTMKEKGADLQFSVWRGIGVPKATPASVVEKWRAAARQVAQSQDFQALMRKQSLTPSYADQPQFAADVARQEEAFKALVPKLNLKP